MSSDSDTLTIDECPKCGSLHKYQLEVSRTLVFYHVTLEPNRNVKPVRRTFTRLFTCPTKGEDFQATFWLLESPMHKIESVQVSGLAKETGNG